MGIGKEGLQYTVVVRKIAAFPEATAIEAALRVDYNRSDQWCGPR